MTSPESYLGVQPACYLAYTAGGKGLECAVTYYVDGADVMGWWIGFKDFDYPSAFFKLEQFFSAADTVFFATDGSDIYGGWRFLYSKSQPRLSAPVRADDELCHKLMRLQDAFANEWLWVRDGSDHAQEEATYAGAELPLQQVNVRFRMLGKFNKSAAIWTYESHDLNLDVLNYITHRWPLDYGK